MQKFCLTAEFSTMCSQAPFRFYLKIEFSTGKMFSNSCGQGSTRFSYWICHTFPFFHQRIVSTCPMANGENLRSYNISVSVDVMWLVENSQISLVMLVAPLLDETIYSKRISIINCMYLI